LHGCGVRRVMDGVRDPARRPASHAQAYLVPGPWSLVLGPWSWSLVLGPWSEREPSVSHQDASSSHSNARNLFTLRVDRDVDAARAAHLHALQAHELGEHLAGNQLVLEQVAAKRPAGA